jgi:hypothetical protein
MTNAARSIAAEPNGGETRWFLGTLAKIDGDQTDGRFAIFESLLPKEAAPPLHTHPQDETFSAVLAECDVANLGPPPTLEDLPR